MKYGLKDEEIILFMNNIIKSNKIDYKLIDKDSIRELRRTTQRYSKEYKKLKVYDSCYNNTAMLSLFYTLDKNITINRSSFGTDDLVKVEYNKHKKLNQVN